MTAAGIDLQAPADRLGVLRLVLPMLALLSALALPTMAVLLNSYDYPHGWVSAHFATIAKSYLEHGVIALGAVPIQNNAPLTALPDAYLNWPPLYPLALSGVFAILGESEIIHHLFASAINMALGGILAAAVCRRFGLLAASVSAIVYFNAPILAKYGHVGSQLHLSLLLCVASLWLFAIASERMRLGQPGKWMAGAAGCAIYNLSVLASWEPVLAVPGLALFAAASRDRKAFALSIAYGVVAVVTVCGVFAVYWAEYSYFGDAILQRIMLRSGMEVAYDPAVSAMFDSPHFIQETHEPRGDVASGYFFKISFGALMMQGLLGVAGICAAYKLPIWNRSSKIAYIICGVASIYMLWAIVMRQHMDIHDYQILLLAPVSAILAGALASMLFSGILDIRNSRLASIATALALVLIPAAAFAFKAPFISNILEGHDPAKSSEISFARQIENVTQPGAIVVHADRSMVPVYYSRRHVIRSVRDEETFRKNRAGIEALCTDCPIYLAIPERYRPGFAEFIARNKPISDSDLGSIFRLR